MPWRLISSSSAAPTRLWCSVAAGSYFGMRSGRWTPCTTPLCSFCAARGGRAAHLPAGAVWVSPRPHRRPCLLDVAQHQRRARAQSQSVDWLLGAHSRCRHGGCHDHRPWPGDRRTDRGRGGGGGRYAAWLPGAGVATVARGSLAGAQASGVFSWASADIAGFQGSGVYGHTVGAYAAPSCRRSITPAVSPVPSYAWSTSPSWCVVCSWGW